MFRHTGKSRTFLHNLKLAALLSLVAGMVNVTGIFSIHELTTNVTGHFAFFAEEIGKKDYLNAVHYLLFILSFFSGALISSLLVESISRINKRLTNIIPILLEASILATIPILGNHFVQLNAVLIACFLLFAMGIQNALVTQISNSVVRTTHLTGLFTDLGIELAQLFFYREPDQLARLKLSIKLRLMIILFFFVGCVFGGFLFHYIALYSLLLAAFFLIGGLTFDVAKFKYKIMLRKYKIRS